MADVHSAKIRSYNMSRIRSKDTKPELVVRKFLFSKGFRYRLHDEKLPGKPDIVLPRYKTVIFVNGCFWHGHQNCNYAVLPKTRTKWWGDKIKRNSISDTTAIKKLLEEGWNVISLWTCELKPKIKQQTLESIPGRISISLS